MIKSTYQDILENKSLIIIISSFLDDESTLALFSVLFITFLILTRSIENYIHYPIRLIKYSYESLELEIAECLKFLSYSPYFIVSK